MANPQLENGFIRIANDLYKALYKVKLSGSELRVAHFITYQTYGYNKKSRVLTASYISIGTNIPCDTVQKALDKLIKKNIIISKSIGSHSVRELSLNKNYSTWLVENGKPKMANQNILTELVENGKPSSDKMANNTRQIKQDRIKQDSSSSQTTTTPPTLEEIKEYCQSKGYTFDCERFFYRYEPVGWIWQGSPIKNWKALADRWQITEKEEKAEQPKEEEPKLDMWGKPIKPKWE